MIDKIYIENFKVIKKMELGFNEDINIIVGDNETGKSTILEAINMALTGQINRRYINNEITPYLFNKDIQQKYVEKINNKEYVLPPSIIIELYLNENDNTVKLKGTNNEYREDTTGISLRIEFDEDYQEEYETYINETDEIYNIPSEYYTVNWYSFAYKNLTKRRIPLNTTLIDATTIRLQYRTDYYIQEIINDNLTTKEKTQLAISYRELKQQFTKDNSLERINDKLKEDKGKISEKDIKVSIDISQKTSWEANLTTYLDEIPFQYIGKGDQNILKTLLALERDAEETHIVLIEEPENHLSFATMNMLIKMISEKCEGKQLFITTHSTFVLNKLGLDNVILLGKDLNTTNFKEIKPDTEKYFKKLPGYDTLRLIIAKKAILVEGPSDELIIQKAYKKKYDKLPIEDGIDIISVRGLSFKRFLEIAEKIKKEIIVVTDNDGDYENKVEEKYKEFKDFENIRICYDKDNNYKTLESQIVKYNEIDHLKKILGIKKDTEKDLLEYMINNKTECALRIFESKTDINIPQYIKDAIE